jgi:alpha-aminoadipic semialdehyde synthase
MAVDNLPCEFPREASEHFSTQLRELLPDLVAANWQDDFASLALPPHLKRAVIVHQGRLTPEYEYLRQHLEA